MIKKILTFLALSVWLVCSVGCVTSGGGGTDRSLTFRNYVLDKMEASTSALKAGNTGLAAMELDQAISGIESVFGYDEAAQKARSLWYAEESKVFKGEAYERAMVFYYRGLIYLKAGEIDNARACFKNGMLQDAFAEEEQNRCDFAIFALLQHWCSLHLNDLDNMKAAEEELALLRPDLELPKSTDNVLFVIDTGTSPRKLGDGVGQEKLVYRRGKQFKEEQVKITVGEQQILPVAIDSVFWQATSRGGRKVDAILQGKAIFQQNAANAGDFIGAVGNTAMVMAPLSTAASSDWTNYGAGLVALGATVQLIALHAKPTADTRYWHGLPDLVHCSYAEMKPGAYTAKFEFLDKDGVIIPVLTKSVSFSVETGKPTVVWTSSR